MPFIKTITDEERLLAKRRIAESGCWEWTGCVKKPLPSKPYLPYGQMHIGSRTNHSQKVMQVHRVAASLWMGLDLNRSDIHVLHKCDNPICFNPDHLFFGDNALNVADRHAKGRNAIQRGESAPNSKLTEDQVRQIRVAAGNHREIGERFGVSRPAVTSIKARRSWRHVA